MAAKSRLRRQMNGASSARNSSPALDVAGDRARLDERSPLPVLPEAFVVDSGRIGRVRSASRPVRPQPQVGAEHIRPSAGPFLHELNQLTRSPTKNDCGSAPSPESARSSSKKHDEIDVARIVELVRAVFPTPAVAEPKTGLSASADTGPDRPWLPLPGTDNRAQRTTPHPRLRPELARHLHDRPDPGEIGQRRRSTQSRSCRPAAHFITSGVPQRCVPRQSSPA